MRKYFSEHRYLCGLVALILLIALAAAVRYQFPAEPGAAPAPAANSARQPEIKEQPPGIVRAGSVENASAIAVNSGFSGRVSEIYVKEGQAVKAGQPLFKLEAAAGAASAGQKANAKTGILSPGEDGYENALKEYNRLQKLYEQGAIPRRQVETAAARLQAAQQNSRSGRSVTLNEPATITAPVDGIVTGLAAAAGGVVQAGQQVMALGSGQALEIVVPLEQKELYLVPLGAQATAEVADQVIKGKVASIFPAAQENKVSAFLAHIVPANPPAGILKIGMSVNVRIDTGEE